MNAVQLASRVIILLETEDQHPTTLKWWLKYATGRFHESRRVARSGEQGRSLDGSVDSDEFRFRGLNRVRVEKFVMLQLAGSIIAPVLGALLYKWLHGRPSAVRLFDRCMYVAVPAIVLWQVLPHSWEDHGFLAILVLLLGMGTPNLIERISRSLAPHADNLALLAGWSGLLIHALLEGAALVSNDMGFAYAVILHRIPVGLMIWWILRPRHGFRGAAIGIGTILVATVAGYAIGTRVFFDGAGVEIYQAFVGGTLLHAVFHQGRHDHSHDHGRGTRKPAR